MRLTKRGIIRINFRDFLPGDRRRLKCNFNCSYCIQYRTKEVSFSEREYKQCKKIWDMLAKIEDKIIVRFNFDGEILADPWARKIIGYVSRLPNIKVCEVITNNSIHPKHYLKDWNVSKMSFNCSFHPECINLERFLSHINYLKKRKCPVFVTMVVTPQMIEQLPEIAREFKKRKIIFHPLLLLGPYWGKNPRKKIKKLLYALSSRTGIKSYPISYSFYELQRIYNHYPSKIEFRYQYGERTKGKLCYAGMEMINIFMDGTVRRCFTPKSQIGTVEELVTGKIMLPKEPLPCPVNTCTCPTHMIFLKEARDKYQLSEKFADLLMTKNEIKA